jgi:predicted small integral membrane protein
VIDRTTTAFRVVALLLEAGTALMASIVVIGNVTDPQSNLQFVEKTLSMDTTFHAPRLMWRAIRNRTLHRIAFISIVVIETLVAITGWMGAVALATNLHSPEAVWHDAKFWSVVALGLAAFVWFVLFQIVGNEWFASWQSEAWNAIRDSTRINIVTFAALTLLLLST